MIDDRAITEARRRLHNKAQNEQTSVTFSELLRIAEQENKQLREENERLRKDAERYRWLSDDGGIHSLPYDDFGCGPVFDLSRDAIDARCGTK